MASAQEKVPPFQTPLYLSHVLVVLGKTKTSPAPDDISVGSLKLATFSCACHWCGFLNAYREIAADSEVDIVIGVGDWLYPPPYLSNLYGGSCPRVPAGMCYTGAECNSYLEVDGMPIQADCDVEDVHRLTDMRHYHRILNADVDVRDLRAAHPMILIPDNHDINDDVTVSSVHWLYIALLLLYHPLYQNQIKFIINGIVTSPIYTAVFHTFRLFTPLSNLSLSLIHSNISFPVSISPFFIFFSMSQLPILFNVLINHSCTTLLFAYHLHCSNTRTCHSLYHTHVLSLYPSHFLRSHR